MPTPGRVSVIIPCYNQQDFIEPAVRSVLDQTYRDLEVIVTDDGSTDGSPDIIRSLAAADARVVPVLSPRNAGIAANMNRALPRCSGEFVAQLDGDDLMLPTKIERQVAYLRAHPECVVCNHDVEVFDSATDARLFLWSEQHAPRIGGVELELSTNYILRRAPKTIPSAALMRARAVPAHGWDERLRFANDWLFGIEVLRHGRRGYIPEVLVRYRRHANNISRPMPGLDAFEELMMVLAIVETRYPELAPRARRTRDFLLFQHALFAWDDPALRTARERQLRKTTGLLPWLYMRAARYIISAPELRRATRPLRGLVRRLIPHAGDAPRSRQAA